MNIDNVTAEMTRDLGPNPVLVFLTNAAGHTVAIAASCPEVLDELREMGLVITDRAPELRKAS
jgi:hypothetical protein